MPTYKYRCPTCKDVFERVARMKDRDNQVCHKCLEPLEPLINFKGAVWSQHGLR